MTEEEIAQNLKQNLPQEAEFTPPAPDPVNTDQVHGNVPFRLDDIAQYKLHDFFGAKYRPTDEISVQQVNYIYENVAKMVDTPEYGFVVSKIRELERLIGTSNSEQRIFKLYQWIKLDNLRRNIEAEMGAIA